MSTLYYAGAAALAAVSVAGIVDYYRRPLPGPEAPVDPLPGCSLDCPVRTWCEDCDEPLCGAHATDDDHDPRACFGNSMDTRCHDCAAAHAIDCDACEAATAGRW